MGGITEFCPIKSVEVKYLSLIAILLFSTVLFGQEEEKKKWYQNFSISGYLQVRYNGLYESNPNLECDQCDRNWGDGSSLSIRRARLVISGQVHPRLFIYIQPDFASSSGEGTHFGQLRDAYFDVGIDKQNEFRIRVGQSKVPYSFENLQSSRNRLTLDRNDGMNSSFTNERDLGVYLMWAPTKRRELFKTFVDEGLKGSGDYGVVAFGFSNGQPANSKELNRNKHVSLRFSYPFQVKEHYMEAGIFGYSGTYTMMDKDLSSGTQLEKGSKNFVDQRVGAHYILYPQPFGIQAEYNIGHGPQYNPASQTIETQSLQGGYVLANYRIKIKNQLLFPFIKYHFYDGGKKFERDARSYKVNELNAGLEWQPFKNFEFVAMYSYSDRTFEDHQRPSNRQFGHSVRFQVQVMF